MRAYMKSAMPFRGVQSAAQRRIWRDVFTRHPIADPQSWRETALALWREATYREERYAAIGAHGLPPYEAWQTLETIPMYEETDRHRRVVGLRGRDRRAPHRSAAREVSRRDAPAPAAMEPRCAPLEASHGDSGAAHVQGAHGRAAAPRLYRAEPRRRRLLRAQGDWLGAPPARTHGSGRGCRVRRRQPVTHERPQPPRGDQDTSHGTVHRRPFTVDRSPVGHRQGIHVRRWAINGRSAIANWCLRNDSRRMRAGKSLPCASTVGYAQAADARRRVAPDLIRRS